MHVDNALLFMLGNYLQRVSIPLRSAQQMPRDAPDLIRFVCPSFRPSFRRRTGLRHGRRHADHAHGLRDDVLGEHGRGAVPDVADDAVMQSWRTLASYSVAQKRARGHLFSLLRSTAAVF